MAKWFLLLNTNSNSFEQFHHGSNFLNYFLYSNNKTVESRNHFLSFYCKISWAKKSPLIPSHWDSEFHFWTHSCISSIIFHFCFYTSIPVSIWKIKESVNQVTFRGNRDDRSMLFMLGRENCTGSLQKRKSQASYKKRNPKSLERSKESKNTRDCSCPWGWLTVP